MQESYVHRKNSAQSQGGHAAEETGDRREVSGFCASVDGIGITFQRRAPLVPGGTLLCRDGRLSVVQGGGALLAPESG